MKLNRALTCALLGVGLISFTAPLAAQPAGVNYADKSIDLGKIDLSVPESPAFVPLGLTTENVVRPSSPRELAVALLNGVDRNGNVQAGLAIDTAPYMLYFGDKLTIRHYREHAVTRFLSRIQLSVASAKGASSDDETTKIAGGLRLTIFDLGDPRMDTQMDKDFDDASGDFLHPSPTASEAERRRAINEATAAWKSSVEEIQARAEKRLWNRSSWVIGAAPSWQDGTNRGSFHRSSATVWSSIGYGFENVPVLENTSQFILHVRYQNDESVPVPDGNNSFYSQDSLFVGARLRMGKPDFNGSFEGAVVKTWPDGRENDTFYRIAFGLEKKVARDIWLNASLGKNLDSDNGKNDVFILGAIRFGWSSKPKLAN